MKWVIITGFFGLIGLIAIAYGVWHYWHNNQIDTTRPGFADVYEKGFTASCARGAEASVVKSGQTVDEKMRARIHDICVCGAKDSMHEFKTKEHMTMAEMLSDPMLQEKLPAIMQSCANRFGG